MKNLLISDRKQSSIWQDFVALSLVFIVCLFVFSIISQLLFKLFHISPAALQSEEMLKQLEPSQINQLKLIDALTRIGLLGLPAWLTPRFMHKKASGFLQLNRGFVLNDLLILAAFTIICYPFLESLITWNANLHLPGFFASAEEWMRNKEDGAAILLEQFLNTTRFSTFLINLVVIALLPAVFEELFFRGLLQNLVYKWTRKIHLSILLTSFLFSAIHLQFFGFFPRLMLGIMFGYMLYWTKSLWLPILFHFINNGLTVTFVYFNAIGKTDIDIENTMNTNNLVSIISFALAAAFFLLLAQYYQRKKKKTDAEEDTWQTVYSTSQLFEAEIIKGKLDAENIPVVLLNQKDRVYTTHGNIELKVEAANTDKAKAIISNTHLEVSE